MTKNSYSINRACTAIANALLNSPNQNPINLIRTLSKHYNLPTTPSLSAILSSVPLQLRQALSKKILSKPVRTASGVAVVAIMCKPHRCPHIALTGNVCIYCPGGPDSDFSYSSQSYTGYEPTSMRAIRARYDAYEQVKGRIEQLRLQGHSVNKVEVIIMGGTFMSLPKSYKTDFIKKIYDSLNRKDSPTLEQSKTLNEATKQRLVGLTIETRPDFCLRTHIRELLSYGCTRVEIGVQSVYEDVAYNTNRGHTVLAVRGCFKLCKTAGLKIVAHLMPNLPDVDEFRDRRQFEEFFENPAYRTDGLKIYPTLVMRGTGLYELYKSSKYKSYTPQFLIDFLARALVNIPPWCRVYRIQRDIPMPLVTSGVEKGNIRELVSKRMEEYNTKVRDVRSREAGLSGKKIESVSLVRRDYWGNGGWETFLSVEDLKNDILVGMCRLRCVNLDNISMNSISDISMNSINDITDNNLKFLESQINKTFKKSSKIITKSFSKNELTFDKRITPYDSIIRELHIYDTSTPLSTTSTHSHQHQGYGTLLIKEAERISKEEHMSRKIGVISGIGVREYYRRLGYEKDGEYMTKVFL